MSRRRPNDPAGVSDAPNAVSDPTRVAELVQEFQNRLAYIRASYSFWIARGTDKRRFNSSLANLKRALTDSDWQGEGRARLDPELEILINFHARRLAGLPEGEVLTGAHIEFVRQAAIKVASTTKARRGRPPSRILRHHVEGLMALAQETTGIPVVAQRYRLDHYRPYFRDPVGQMIEQFFKRLDPLVTTTQLVDIIRGARQKYAGKRMRFSEFFPGYGARPHPETGDRILAAPHRLESLQISAPIYCPSAA